MTVTVERGGRVVEKRHHASPRRPRSPRDPRDSYALFLLPGALAFLAVIVVPFLMNTGVSFTDWQGVGEPGVDRARQLPRADGRLGVLGVLPAQPLHGRRDGGRTDRCSDSSSPPRCSTTSASTSAPTTAAVLRACFYLPQVLPIAVAGIVWSWILAPDNGSLNELLKAVGLGSWQQDWLGDPDIALYSVMGVMVWVQIGFPLVIFMAGLQRVDPQLYEAAELDGAGWWRRFWHITLPQIRPEIYVVLLWCTIAALKVFGAVYVLTKGGPGGATNVPSYFSFTTFFEKTQVGYGAAISTVLTVIILVLALIGPAGSRPARRTPRKGSAPMTAAPPLSRPRRPGHRGPLHGACRSRSSRSTR